MDEKTELGRQVYSKLCAALDARNWQYDRYDEELTVLVQVRGDDIPMPFMIRIDPRRCLIRLTSTMTFNIAEEKRVEAAIATCAANFSLADGSFNYDFRKGKITFRMTATYRSSNVSDSLLQYMISCAIQVVDRFNDKFLRLSLGSIDVSEFFN